MNQQHLYHHSRVGDYYQSLVRLSIALLDNGVHEALAMTRYP